MTICTSSTTNLVISQWSLNKFKVRSFIYSITKFNMQKTLSLLRKSFIVSLWQKNHWDHLYVLPKSMSLLFRRVRNKFAFIIWRDLEHIDLRVSLVKTISLNICSFRITLLWFFFIGKIKLFCFRWLLNPIQSLKNDSEVLKHFFDLRWQAGKFRNYQITCNYIT